MTYKKELPVHIEKQDQVSYIDKNGYGLILDNDKKVSVPFCLAGEKVLYTEVKRKKRTDYYFKNVITPSEHRQKPFCEHFSDCGGCMLQHMKEIDYKEYKKSILTQLFVENALDPFVLGEVVVLPHGLRRRANMDAIKKEDGIHLGFHRLKSHAILNINNCIVLEPALQKLLKPLNACLDKVLGLFQKAKIFMTNTAVGVDLSLEIQNVSTLSEEQIEVLHQFAVEQGVCRLLFKYRKTIVIILQKEKPYVLIDDYPIMVNPWSFLQASSESDRYLTQWIQEALPQKKDLYIIDLFCGRGTFTIPLSRYGKVYGYENDKEALAALGECVSKFNHQIEAHNRNLFDEPLSSKDLQKADVIILDPPRAGSLSQCEELAKTSVPLIIYVSCNPETFVRDMNILQKAGYILEKTHLLDQFIYTTHMETVSIIRKR
jgi:23S rRNA (uracil1939-C5)-methyltransferase